MKKQFLLVVDDTDTFLGEYKEKELCHRGKGIHHRAFVVCLFNKKNEILLQLRKHKRWDKFWDVTSISHVLHLPDYDETYEQAGRRSLKDEMGITGVALKKVGGFNYFAEHKNDMCENEYCAVLVGTYTGDVFPNSEVLYKYKWMDKKAFITDCKKNPRVYAPWTLFTAELLNTL
jgi:isopentenyl-diphosphate delta-isomerase